MLKVAYVLPTLQKPSGWWTFCTALLRHISQQVDPVLFAPAESLAAISSEFPTLALHSLPTTQQQTLASLGGLKKLLASYQSISQTDLPQVDLVHSLEAYPTGLVGVWLARRLQRPHLLTAHGTYSVIWAAPRTLLSRLDLLAYRWVLRSTRMICPVSEGTSRLIQQKFAAALTHTLIKPILPGNCYTHQVTQEKAFNRLLPAVPTLLTVGDIKPRKGQHISLAAFSLLKAHLPQARYWITGSYDPEQAYFQQLQRFIQENQVQDVTFLGKTTGPELRRCFEQASVFILTPQMDGLHFEGFGQVYLEAGAYGLPVVATRTGGVPDAVLDNETGFLTEPGDVQAIASAALRLLVDPALAISMGRHNRLWAEKLTWQRFTQLQIEAYQLLLGRDEL